MNELHTLYVKKLQKALNIEEELIATLPRMSQHATSTDLRAAIEEHLAETKVHKSRIEEILRSNASADTAKPSSSFKELLKESEAELSEITDPILKDAFIIASARTVEHLEMSIYMSLLEWAKELEDSKGDELLKQTLKEEEAAEKKLAGIATGGLFGKGVNEAAAEM